MIKKFALLFVLIPLLSFKVIEKLPKEFYAKVIGVKDGDTIEVLYKKQAIVVRLEHIDCPERKNDFWQKSKNFTANFCFGKTVKIISKNKYDRYRRLIASVEFNNLILNKQLVKNGYAIHFKKYSKDTAYNSLEKLSRLKKMGMWSEVTKKITDTTKVYICNSTGSKRYHKFESCSGLSHCKDTIRKIALKKAINFGRTLCSYE